MKQARVLLLTVILSLCAGAGVRAAEPVAAWDFEGDETGWRPVAETMTLERVVGGGATTESRTCLHVYGRMNGAWNYARSDVRPMLPGRIYRLSAWLRVERLGRGTNPPYLKCEFVGPPGNGFGRVNTDRYQTAHVGEWQRLVAEFRAPQEVERCWVAIEKGTTRPAELDAYVDDVSIELLERFTWRDRYVLDPIPAPLEAVRGVHPRLYLSPERLDALRRAVRTTHAALWEEVRQQADRAAAAGPPDYRREEQRSGGNREQLWQRPVGNAMPHLAMAYLLTNEAKYLDAAQDFATASCGYPTWGLGKPDLAAGHQLFGLAIIYDWCHDDLDEAVRRTIRETLMRRGSQMFEAAATGSAWWSGAYLQNHLWVSACGLATAGLAVFGDAEPGADQYGPSTWAALALDKFRRTVDALGPDGASHEGVGYWTYGVEYMLKFMHLARDLLGADLYDNPWWRNTASYRLYLALPRGAWTRRNSIVDIADCPRWDWYGPEYMLRRLARQYGDGHAQWLARALDEADVCGPEAGWLNLIWYDPDLPERAPDDLPTLRHFDDMGIVSARSDWSGDESLVVFKCGPFIGHQAIQAFDYDPGGGHVHPDADHFVVFGCGEWLICDDGYQKKQTGQHNTLLIDGEGQLGEGGNWFAGSEPLAVRARPRVLRSVSTPALDHVAGDAAEAYPAGLGLERFMRHLLFVKPDVLIVADDIALDAARELEIRFHPEHAAVRASDGSYLARGKKSLLRLDPLTPEGVNVSAEDVRVSAWYESTRRSLFTIRLRESAGEWRNAVALSWAPSGAEPARVTLDREGDAWTFRSGQRVVELDWASGEARLSRP